MNVSSGYMKHGFDAYGGKVLRKEDMAHWLGDPLLTDPRGVALGLDEEVEEVEEGFFELLPTISEVWMYNRKCRLGMNESTAELFKKNRVLLRGEYDSAAEKLARAYGLRFLHLDVQLVSVGDYFERGNDTVTIRFRSDGSVYVHEDCRCQGISAGSTGGGETSFDLPADFYLKMTPEELADMCWGTCRAGIRENGRFAAFIKKAERKKGFLLDFSGEREK